MNKFFLLGTALTLSTSAALACPGTSVEIPLATDSCNPLSGAEYAKCLTDRKHSVEYGQLSAITASGRGFTIEGRTFVYHPIKATWCEQTSAGCLQVYPRPDSPSDSSVLVGFCLANNLSKGCQLKGLPEKGSARKDPRDEVGYIAFQAAGASIRPTFDKDGYEYSLAQRFMLIGITSEKMGGMFGLRFESQIYDPTLKSLGQTYNLASNMDLSGSVYRGLPRADETSSSAKPIAFGTDSQFTFSAGCGPLKQEH